MEINGILVENLNILLCSHRSQFPSLETGIMVAPISQGYSQGEKWLSTEVSACKVPNNDLLGSLLAKFTSPLLVTWLCFT